MDHDLLAQHVDAVHAAALPDFVSERTARSRQLQQDGHREEAAALAKLRKPTVAAWAVNQLARQHADVVTRLVEAGGDLRAAQLQATSGRGADELRPATRTVRDLAADLASRADGILEEVGAGDHHAEVEQTLFAAAVDPDLHERLRRGHFERPVEAAGFGAMASLAVVPAAPDDHAEGDDGSGRADGDSQEAGAPDPEELRRRQAAEASEARRRELQSRHTELQRALLRHQRRADQARARAADLQARADELGARAREAAAESETAQAALDRLAGELTAVEQELEARRG